MSDSGTIEGTPPAGPSTDPAQAIGRAAHDLNNFCSSILGFAALAQESLDPSSPLQEYLREILEAGRKASGVANDLRRIARQLRDGSSTS